MPPARTKDFATLLAEAKERNKFDKTTLEPLVAHKGEIGKGEQVFLWDQRNPGFGLKFTPTKAVYVVQRRVGTGKGVRLVRAVVADYMKLTVEEARDKAREYFKDMRDGVDPNAEKKALKAAAIDAKNAEATTLPVVLAAYFNTYGSKLRPKTKDVYENAIKRCFGDGSIKTKKGTVLRPAIWESWLEKSITDIDEDMVAQRHIALSNANGPRGKGEAQANQAMRVLRTLMGFAIEHYKDSDKKPLITGNPVRALKTRRLWNENVAREDILTDEQLAAWYKGVSAVDNSTIKDFLLLCLFTGLRRSEAAKLKWEKVRLTGAKPMLIIPKEDTKTGVEHKLPLSDVVLSILQRRSKVRQLKNPYVFPGEKPESHLAEPKGVIAKVVQSTGCSFSCHTLRRTFGTVAGRLDIAHYKHKALMNHSAKADVTANHYLKLTEEDLREPMQKIADHLKLHMKMSATFEPLDASILVAPDPNALG